MKHIAENYFTNHAECSDMIIAFSVDSLEPVNTIYFQKKKLTEQRDFYIRVLVVTIFINLFFIVAAFCQLLTNNNVSISIATGTQLTVQGSIQNKSGTTIANSGTIDLTGDWIHNAANDCFGSSQGTVVLNGANQNIGGTNSTTFNNLILGGTGTKTLSIDAATGGSSGNGILDLGSRTLDLNSKTLTINNASSPGISYSAGMILSEVADNSSIVEWNIRTNTGNHVIPFGTISGVTIPLNINLTAGDIGAVSASTYPTAPDNTPYPAMPVLVTHVHDLAGNDNSANTVDRFWEIDKTGLSGTATVTFTYAPSEAAANGTANARAQRWNSPSAGWDGVLPGQTNPTIYSATVPFVNNYGAWTLSLQASPLPVELLQFAAKANKDKQVDVSWTTESETNNAYFTVERSKDGINFNTVKTIDGAGNSTSAHRYSTVDTHPYPGTSYYRLMQTDFNGAFTYSDVKAVTINDEHDNSISIYPNPVISEGYIQFSSAPEYPDEITFELSDAIGRKVFQNKIAAMKTVSGNTFQFNREQLRAGIYFYTIKTQEVELAGGKIVMQ